MGNYSFLKKTMPYEEEIANLFLYSFLEKSGFKYALKTEIRL
jgi:hypothetical protein